VGTPAGQEIVSAGTVPALPVKVSAGTVPADPVNVGAATVPAGVKLAVAFDPVGVTLFAPPVVPTSPFAAIVPYGIAPLSAETSEYPPGQAVIIIKIVPRGTSFAER
jgi:hypothetical protein